MKKRMIFPMLAISVLFALGCFTGCKAWGELFNKNTLDRHEISWLTKPENASNENEYFSNDYRHYAYEATIPSEEAYLTYCQNLIDRLRLDAYHTGYYADSFTAYDFWLGRTVIVISPSQNLNDYLQISNDENLLSCHIYYSRSLLQPYDESYHGYPIKKLHRIAIRFYRQPNEGFNFQITLRPGNSKLQCYRP